MAAATLHLWVETGKQKVVVSVAEWPGWTRIARTEDAAIADLDDHAGRYRDAVSSSGLRVPVRYAFAVAERLPGTGTTDFGAPDAMADAERAPLTAAGARRAVSILEAAWATLDRIAANAPEALRKGPRGGGRDTSKVYAHVIAAEHSYSRKLGLRHTAPDPTDADAVAAARQAMTDALRVPGATPASEQEWSAAYAVRRMTWHVLDHAWEIEDKST